MITFKCPECKESLQCEESMAGEFADCEHCGKTIRIPNPTDPKRAMFIPYLNPAKQNGSATSEEQLGILKQINQNLMSLRESCEKTEACVSSFYKMVVWAFILSVIFYFLLSFWNSIRPLL